MTVGAKIWYGLVCLCLVLAITTGLRERYTEQVVYNQCVSVRAWERAYQTATADNAKARAPGETVQAFAARRARAQHVLDAVSAQIAHC